MDFIIDPNPYSSLWEECSLQRIRSEEENERALQLVDRLLDKIDRTPEEETLLDLWTTLIQEFEEDFYHPDTHGDGVDVLACLIDAHSMTQADLVNKVQLGSSGVVSQLLNRKRGISKSQAKKLADYFHVDVGLFI